MKGITKIFLIVIALGFAPGAFAQNFAIPRPPEGLRTPEKRAGWLVEHYWDNADLKTLEGESLESAFATYLMFFPIAKNDSICHVSSERLMGRAVEDGVKERYYEVAQKYLFEMASPSMNEEYFRCFLPWSPYGDYLRKVLDNNRVGTLVQDFVFTSLNGRKLRFSDIHGKRLLLLFEVSCSDCKKTIEWLKTNAPKDCKVVAVAVNSTLGELKTLAGTLPESWYVGYDKGDTINGGAFAIRKLPDLYLISEEGIVLEKHYRPFLGQVE